MCFGIHFRLKSAAIKNFGLPHGIVQMEREDMGHSDIEALQSRKVQDSGALIAFLISTFCRVIFHTRSDEQAETE